MSGTGTPRWVVMCGSEYAVPDEIAKRQGLTDVSWDTGFGPAFQNDDLRLLIRVDHPDAEAREKTLGEGTIAPKRFALMTLDDDLDYEELLLETDDLAEAVALISHIEEVTP